MHLEDPVTALKLLRGHVTQKVVLLIKCVRLSTEDGKAIPHCWVKASLRTRFATFVGHSKVSRSTGAASVWRNCAVAMKYPKENLPQLWNGHFEVRTPG